MKYTPTIGLEIHAELKTRTKMFCGSLNEPHAAEPNTHVCPICMGHPGTLPVVNKEAVKKVLTVGIALGGTLAAYTQFDRKNYFYPDIPKGYQISQYQFPLVSGGELAGVKITRVHLEEDTARSLHDQGAGSLVDYNRAGVPLMELVTEPVIHDAETAGNFARELRLLLKTLGASDANMEKGEMRVEANISVSKDGTLGTKVEVKNLNSFKAVEGAIAYEVARQIKVLEEGGTVVQETRGWDESMKVTNSQRKKESSHDYRYFKDPDIPSIDISIIEEYENTRLSEIMPELPSNKRLFYSNLGLTSILIEAIINNDFLSSFFDRILKVEQKPEVLKIAANYIASDVAGALAPGDRDLKVDEVLVANFVDLAKLVSDKKITSRTAKDLLPEVIFESKSPSILVQERGLLADTSEDAIAGLVDEIINANESVVSDVKAGKEAAMKFLVGQGMKLSKGKAEPILLVEMIRKRIAEM